MRPRRRHRSDHVTRHVQVRFLRRVTREGLAPERHVADAAILHGYRILACVLEGIGGHVGFVAASNYHRLGLREFILRQHALGLEIRQFFDLRRERGHDCCPEMLP